MTTLVVLKQADLYEKQVSDSHITDTFSLDLKKEDNLGVENSDFRTEMYLQ